MRTLPEPPRSISMEDVDWEDRTFEIRAFAQGKDLRKSLDRCGCLDHPWVVLRENGRHAIVDGFKRMEWLRERGTGRVSCLAFRPDTGLGEIWLCHLTVKVFGPRLNLAEKAQVVARIVEFVSSEEAKRELLASLGVSSRPEIVSKWSQLGLAEPKILEAAANGTLGERAALELASWIDQPEARDRLLDLIELLRCSASIQMELVERVSELAVARGVGRIEVLRDPEIERILTHDQWNHREKTQALRDLLARYRFPRLHGREDAFRKRLARLDLPQSLHIVPPPAFEGDGFQLRMDFASPAELMRCLEAARTVAEDPRLAGLLRPDREGNR